MLGAPIAKVLIVLSSGLYGPRGSQPFIATEIG